MKTKKVRGQRFVEIEYTNNNSHKPTRCWYPIENLIYLKDKTDYKVIGYSSLPK